MEWKLLNDDDNVDLLDDEIEIREVLIDNDSIDELNVLRDAHNNPRRAIEILREQKELDADTCDFLDY